MSTVTNVTMTDDLDGKDGAKTVQFGFEGVNYEIDLGNLNAANLAKSLDKYINAGRVVVPGTKKVGRSSNSDAAKVRAWAEEQGLLMEGKRGRIPDAVQVAYLDAHAVAVV